MNATTTNPASPAQIRFIKRLFDDAAQYADISGVTEAIEPVHNILVLAIAAANNPGTQPEVDKRGASRIIDALKVAEQIIKDHTPAPVKFRKLDDGSWGLHGDATQVQTGAVVTVSKADGSEEEKLVGEVIEVRGPNAIARIQKVSAKNTISPLVAAFHARFGTRYVGVALDTAAGAQNELAFWFIGERYVYQVIGGQGRVYQAPKVQKAIIDRLTAMTDDEVRGAMAAYGVELGHCGVCGRELTDDLSRERGIGPICWSKQGF